MGSFRGRRGCVCDGGSIRGSGEAELGLAAWIEGREERLGLRKKRRGGLDVLFKRTSRICPNPSNHLITIGPKLDENTLHLKTLP